MKTRTYQIALSAAVSSCLILSAVLAYLLSARGSAPSPLVDPVIARGPVASPPVAPVLKSGSEAAPEPPLAPIQLTPQRMQDIGITIATAVERVVSDDLQVPGNVDVDEQRLAYVQTRFPGWIKTVFANATYQYVRKGQPLFTIYSPDLVSSEQEFLLAQQNQAALSGNMQGMAAQESGWLLKAAEERLRQFDVPDATIARIKQTGKVEREIAFDSPVSGFILERNALPNGYVQPDTKLYTVADLSSVWVYANIFQSDIGRIKPGDVAQVTVDAYPGRTFRGHIDQILPQVDSSTRTVRVRLILGNAGLALKPGMFVSVAISARLGRQLVVPSSAVLQSGSRCIAFVDHGGGRLEPRVVQIGPQFDDSIAIFGGIKAGDRVVQSANFLVDSEAQLQAAMQGFMPVAQSQSSASSEPGQDMQVDLATEPSPPRRGNNVLHVRLTDSNGHPVSDAKVQVSFYMPAMPAMGMAALRESATLAPKSNGDYKGVLTLTSGGTWQVAVNVQRNGQTLVTKHLTFDATGGMN